MLLFTKPFHEGLKSGAITLTFRAWEKPHVKAGGRYRCHPIGVLEVDEISRVRLGDVTEEDAKRAGFAGIAEMKTAMRERSPELTDRSEVFRVRLHYGGDGDRVAAALDDKLDEAAVSAIDAALRKLDALAEQKWTAKVLRMIRENPRVAASQLAKKLGRETEPFKVDVRKLKKLGLTQAFEVGYELSPRGVAYLERRARARSR